MNIPIPTLSLFPALDAELIHLLKSLRPEDWLKPTLARQWTVKDIASHLLDGNFRTISRNRDKFGGAAAVNIGSYRDLVDYLNQLNADWVIATRRMSPELLVELLEQTGKQYYACLKDLDPFAPALFSVAWAGEAESQNWFHIAREYTEKWHHQQQIRAAVNRPGVDSREFYFPLIDTFMRALPHVYRDVHAAEGSVIGVTVTGPTGGSWFLKKIERSWLLTHAPSHPSTAVVSLDPETAWKLFTKGMDKTEAEKRMVFQGNVGLGKHLLDMVAVMG